MHGKSKEENMTDEREKKKCECTEGGESFSKRMLCGKNYEFYLKQGKGTLDKSV